MASTNEDVAGMKQSDSAIKQQGGGRRRGHDKSQVSHKYHEEGAAKKKNQAQSSSRHGSRGRGHSGGKDSSPQQGHQDKHRSEPQQSGGSGSSMKSSWPREGGGGHARLQNRTHHHRNSNSTSSRTMEQGRRGQHGRSQDRSHSYRQPQGSSKSSESAEQMCTPLDSGIGMDGGSSPEAAPTESEHIAAGSVSSIEGEHEALVPQANSRTALPEQSTDLALTNFHDPVSSSQNTKTTPTESGGEASQQPVEDGAGNVAHLFYDREVLLSMKECVQSLLKPRGLDRIPAELLKSSNRHSGDGWDSHHGDVELGEDGKTKHPTTLSLIREHDMKQMSRVSLSPQRRSFGSGCSWREQLSGLARQSSTSSADGAALVDQEEVVEQPQRATTTHPLGLHSYPLGPPPSSPHGHTHHPPRVINHVPYRSRLSHGDPPHHWRDNQLQSAQEDEQEPEWMVHGPDNRHQIIELKGLDEHEARKQAEKEAQSREDGASDIGGKEELNSLDHTHQVFEEQPVSTQSENKEPGSPVVMEKRVSHSSPQDQFMLEGFDFSNGLSIYKTFESDSDDEQPEPVILPTSASNPEQLSNALMMVLGVCREPRDVAPVPCERVKAVTLDEIEAPLTRHDDDDASAYRKLVSVLWSSGAMHDEVATPELGSHCRGSFLGPAPIAPPSKSGPVPGRMLYHGSSVERDTGMALAASLQRSVQNSARTQSLEHQRARYSHLPTTRTHQTPLASSSDFTGTQAARWSMTGQQWPTLPPSSSSSHTHHHQQPSPMVASRLTLGQQQPGGNSSWVTEMERKRMAELRHMQQYQEYQPAHQQAHQHPTIFNRKVPSNLSHGQVPSNLSYGQVPSNLSHGQLPSNLSLLPTAVIRQIRSSKPSQSLSDVSQAQQAVLSHTLPHNGRRLDHEVTQRTNQTTTMLSGMLSQSEAQPSLHPPSMMPTSRGMYHASSAYGGMVPHSLRSGAVMMQVDPTMTQAGYLNSPSPSLLSQQLRMGVATAKQSPY